MIPNGTSSYLEPTQESGRDLILRGIEGEVVMLALLKFRETADSSTTSTRAPKVNNQ